MCVLGQWCDAFLRFRYFNGALEPEHSHHVCIYTRWGDGLGSKLSLRVSLLLRLGCKSQGHKKEDRNQIRVITPKLRSANDMRMLSNVDAFVTFNQLR